MMAAAAAGQILKAAGGRRLDSPLVLRHDKDTGVVRLFRLDAALGAVLLLRLDAAICAAVLRLVVADAITGAFVLLAGGRGGPSASGPIPDGFRLDVAAAVHVRLDTAADEVVPVHLDVRTGAVLLLRVDAATGAVLPLRHDAAAEAVPLLRPDAAADADPRLSFDDAAPVVRLVAAANGVPLLGLVTTADGAPLLRLAVAPDAAPRLRFQAAAPVVRFFTAADGAPLLRLAVAADAAPRLLLAAAAHALGLATAADAVLPLRLDVAIGAVPPLCFAGPEPLLPLAAAADAPPLLRVAVAADAPPLVYIAAPFLRLAVEADTAPLLYLVAAADAGQPLRLVQPVHDDSGGVAPCRGSVPNLCDGSGSWTPISTKKASGPKKTKTSVRKRVTVPTRVVKKGVRILVQGPLIQCQYQGGKASKGNTKLVRLKSILGDFVWFAVPIVFVFYPRKVEEEVPKSNLQLSWTWSELFHTNDLEKPTTMILFVIFVSIWIIGYLLASLGKGKQCTRAVANLTLTTVLSVIALVDYGLYKSMASSYMALFGAHFLVMAFCTTHIWLKYIYGQESGVLSAIKGCRCWRLHRSQPAALSDHTATAGLQEPLLRGPDMV